MSKQTQTMELESLDSDEEAERLMPGGSSNCHVVVFCPGDDELKDQASEMLCAATMPDSWDLVFVDPDHAAETARWFGVQSTPSVAVIRDGALLAVEEECSEEAVERLVRFAKRQDKLVDF